MFDGTDGNKLDKDSDLRDVTPGKLAALKWPASFSHSDGRTPKTPERLRGHVRARSGAMVARAWSGLMCLEKQGMRGGTQTLVLDGVAEGLTHSRVHTGRDAPI